MKIRLLLIILVGFPVASFSQELRQVQLPAPTRQGGIPVMEALAKRKSSREFSPRELPDYILSDLLWAAAGVNRPESGLRTAPSSMNMQEIDMYVALSTGLYRYDAAAHRLMPVVSADIRALTGSQPFVKDAPVNLIYVADTAKMSNMAPEDADFYAATDTGFISENVYLYCASTGLATVVRGWIDRRALHKAMKLRPDQKIILAQTVGYPQ